MKRLLAARLFLTAAGLAIWGYGQRTDQSRLQLAGMGVLVIVLLMRFLPARWFEDDEPPRRD